jgi:hypothetical protein
LSKRLFVLLAGVLAIAIAAAGCGGGSDSSSTTSGDTTASVPALTKAELIEQGDAICTKGNKSVETEANEFAKENNIDTKKPTKKQKEEAITEVVVPGLQKQAEEIGELGIPKGDEEKVEAVVSAVEEGADELDSNPDLLSEGKKPLAKAAKLAGAYGFKVCGQG